MVGQRLADQDWSPATPIGAYWRYADRWFAVVPNGDVADLSKHAVTEHEDGTITVSPSILTRGPTGEWHGYLERGIWRSC